MIAISKEYDGNWRRGLLLLVADNFLAKVPEVKVFETIEPKEDLDGEEYIRQLEAEQEEEQITQHPRRTKIESGQTPGQRAAKENETIIALEVQNKTLTEAQWEKTHTQPK